jgi:hypothetical protein
VSKRIFLSNSAVSYQVPNKTGGNLHLWTTFIPEMEPSPKVLAKEKGSHHYRESDKTPTQPRQNTEKNYYGNRQVN